MHTSPTNLGKPKRAGSSLVTETTDNDSNDLGLHVVETSGHKRQLANLDHLYPDSLLFVSAGELILTSTTKPLRRRRRLDETQLLFLQMAGDVHPKPGPASKYPCPVCTRNITSRGVSYKCNRCSGCVHTKCSGLLNAAQYRRSHNWTRRPLLGLNHPAITTIITSNPCSICRTN